MGVVQRRLILTGARAGQTVQLGGYQFVKGLTIVTADNSQIDGPCRYLGRSYKAFEQGSAELAYYQRLDKEEEAKIHGKRNTEASPESGKTTSLPSHVQPDGERDTEISSENSEGTVDSSSGRTGSGSSGDGHQNAGDDRGNTQDQTSILQAIKSLDKKDDEHWTTDGRPRVDAVAVAAGLPNLTRREIDEVASDFCRYPSE